jgi:hypothetical protein
MTDHPELHNGYSLRVEVIHRTERWKNKEDAHGGPGYYPQEEVVTSFYKELSPTTVKQTITKVARGEGF